MSDLRKLTKEQLKIEGNTTGKQLKEWNDIFDLLSMFRKYKLSEIEAYCILSNRYKIVIREKQKPTNDG